MSGAARSSQRSTASWRALSELTFQVAMRIGGRALSSRRPRWRARSNVAVSATAITAIVPAWTGSDTTRSTCSVIEPTMFRAMIGMPTARSSSRGHADVAAHDRAGEDQQSGARQVGDGPDGGGDVLLADERDRVDADPLAAQVVAVGLADRAQRDLGDLCAAADDDHPLAEDAVQRARQVDAADVGQPGERRRRSAVLVEPLDLELDLGRAAGRRRPADRGRGARIRAAGRGDRARSTAGMTSGAIDDARAGSRPSASDARASRAASASGEPRPAAAAVGEVVVTSTARPGSTPPVGSCSSNARPSAANAARVAVGVAGREHQRAVRVLGDADDPGDVDAALAERRRDARERTRPIVELDREPDRHARHLLFAAMVPGRHAARGASRSGRAGRPRLALASRHGTTPGPDRTVSRSSVSRTTRRRAPRCGSSRSGGSPIHLVDLRARPIARRRAAPVRRAARRGGAARSDVAAYRDGGPRLPADGRRRRSSTRLLADPRLLRLPLVRHGNDVTAGRAEADLDGWLRRRDAPEPQPTRAESRPIGRRPPQRTSPTMKPVPQDPALADPDEADDGQPDRRRSSECARHLRMHATPMHETQDRRRGGRMSVTPKASRRCSQADAPVDRGRDSSSSGRPSPAFLDTDPWRALRILSEFVEGFDALAAVGPAITVFGSARTPSGDAGLRAWRATIGRRLARGRLRGHHRRRPGDHGGGQPRLPGGRRPVGRLQHRAAPRAGHQRRTSTSASSSATSSRARRCS